MKLILSFLLLVLTPFLVSGNGDDSEAPALVATSSRSIGEDGGQGVFYAEVVSRDDLLAVNGFIAQVLVYPLNPPLVPPAPTGRDPSTSRGASKQAVGQASDGEGWPGTQIPYGAFDGEIRVMIKLRGVFVPSNLTDPIDWDGVATRNRPLIETRRETERFDKAMRFVWNLIEATDYLILMNPERVEGTVHIVCDVFFDLAGERLSLAKALIEAGHGSASPRDWGKR